VQKQTPLRLLVSGSTGLIGKELCALLSGAGHNVVRLVRSQTKKSERSVFWDPTTGHVNKDEFEGFDGVIHLAGKNVTSGRWTKKRKRELFLSRCRDTWLLSQVLCRLNSPPKVLICASATGYFGDRGDELLTEQSDKGEGFLADLCAEWEKATAVIENRGTRVVHTRFGVVLSSLGGAFAKMEPLFKRGLGVDIKGADPYLSWIALGDAVSALYTALVVEEISGPINVVAPEPLRFSAFAATVAAHFHKRVHLHIPAKWIPFLMGEMGKELLLASCRALPVRLQEVGFSFRTPTLKQALDQI
jgi:uncharacterized protein